MPQASTDTAPLPTWDLTPFFPSLDSRQFTAAHEGLMAGVDRLASLYDRHGVRGGTTHAPTPEEITAVEEVLGTTNEVLEQVNLVTAYLHALITTEAGNDQAVAANSQLQPSLARLRTLRTRFAAWVASLGAGALVSAGEETARHAWPLQRAEESATRQMTETEEDLAAELNLTGGQAWARLHGDITSRLTAAVAMPDGRTETLPMSAVRGLAGHPVAAVRRAAWEAEQTAWPTVAVPLAAALNGVKGQAVVLNRRRGWPDGLEPALFANAVDRATLAAMQSAVTASFPKFRRYLQTKAGLLGHDGGLPWWDLLAPVGDPAASACTWDEATAQVGNAFGSYSPQLRGLFDRALREAWVDAGPREGKRDGAFCMDVTPGVSRVLMNFSGTLGSASTLAHELGHAYHAFAMAERTPLQSELPMALAETASIFCETILLQSMLAGTTDADRRLALLDADLANATQVVVDIHSRFLFESAVFERRAERTLSVEEFCALMTDAQAATYGEGIDPGTRHPWMWAVKPHYYSSAFYNWPYTFGLLFGIGLYAQYQTDPERFRRGYDDLLANTGMGDAAGLAARFEVDVRDEQFWAASLGVLEERVHDFVAAAGSTAPAADR